MDMLKNLINTYRNFSFEEKTIFTTKFSIVFNAVLGISKFV